MTINAAWGPGPWDDEPDDEGWTDEVTGLPARALRNPVMGHWCGYVAVPAGHPWFEGDPMRSPADDLSVEVTFAGGCPGRADDDRGSWWIGFDCAHAWDYVPSYMSSLTGGRDSYKTLDQVQGMAAELAAAIVAVDDRHPRLR